MKTKTKKHSVTKPTEKKVNKVDAEFDAAWARVGTYSSEKRAELETPAHKDEHGKTKARSA